jgi:hypothetical protein
MSSTSDSTTSTKTSTTKAAPTPASAPEPAKETGPLYPAGIGPSRLGATLTSPHGFTESSIAQHQAKYNAELLERVKPAGTEASPALGPGPELPEPRHLTHDELVQTEGYICGVPWARDGEAFVLDGPIDFVPDNLGMVVHELENLNVVYYWTPGGRVPEGHYVKSNYLHPPEYRRRVLGKEEVGG